MDKEWERIKRRFNKKKEIKLRLISLWLGIEPFVMDLIIYLFVILVFEIAQHSFQIIFPYLYETLKHVIEWSRWILITITIVLFVGHAINSLIFNFFIKKGWFKIKRIYLAINDLRNDKGEKTKNDKAVTEAAPPARRNVREKNKEQQN